MNQAPEGRRASDRLRALDRSVLIALRDPVTSGKLAHTFSEARVVPTLAFSLEQLDQLARLHSFALIVLDSGLVGPNSSGCLDDLRAGSMAPIVVIGELDRWEYRGIDVELDRSVRCSEIAQRGVSLIEMNRPVHLPRPLRWGPLELDVGTREARWRNEALHLTTLQFRIMEVLVMAAGGLVSSAQLARRVWGHDTYDDGDRLTAHIGRIRKLTDDASMDEFLLTIRGEGFRLAEIGGPGRQDNQTGFLT